MKYLVFGQYNWEDIERITVLWKQLENERETGKFVQKNLFEPHYFQVDLPKLSKDIQGFWVIETDDPMH